MSKRPGKKQIRAAVRTVVDALPPPGLDVEAFLGEKERRTAAPLPAPLPFGEVHEAGAALAEIEKRALGLPPAEMISMYEGAAAMVRDGVARRQRENQLLLALEMKTNRAREVAQVALYAGVATDDVEGVLRGEPLPGATGGRRTITILLSAASCRYLADDLKALGPAVQVVALMRLLNDSARLFAGLHA